MLQLLFSYPRRARALQSAGSWNQRLARAIHQHGSHHRLGPSNPIASSMRNGNGSCMMARRPRGGFSAEDFDASFGERRFVSLDGYEDDVESMARGYMPDYDSEYDAERRGSPISGGKGAPPKPMAVVSDTPPKQTKPTIQKPPPPRPTPPVLETTNDFPRSFVDQETQAPPPSSSWADEFSGSNNNRQDDDDEGEPICPLSMFASIAEANVTPPPPKPDSQQSRDQGKSPISIAPPQKGTERKPTEIPKPNPRMAPNPRTTPQPRTTPNPSTYSSNSDSGAWRDSGRPSKDMSVAEFRAKYSFIEDEGDSSGGDGDESNVEEPGKPRGANANRQVANSTPRQMPPELPSRPDESEIFQSKSRLTELEEEIFTMHGSKFNLKSYKQVATALFGDPNQSTAKEVLEGVAGSNILAKLVLEYRHVSNTLSKLEKKQSNSATRVKSVVGEATAKPKPTTSASEEDEDESPASTSRLLLLDTSSFIFRAYYSMPPLHRSTDGTPVGAVLGFCNMLNRFFLNSMLQGVQPYVVLCKDASGPTFRNELYREYKANRAEAPMDLIPQFELIYQAAEAYGLVQISAPGYEADDIIATLCKQATEQNMGVDILSGDKDLMQLITNSTTDGGTVTMIDPMTMNRMTHDTVLEKWGVPAHKLGDLLALAGDSADNIPGVLGIGPKIAAQLLEEFGSLESLLENSDQIQQKKRREKLQEESDMARLSKELVTLVPDVPAERMVCIPEQAASLNIEDFRMEPMNADRILEFYDSMRFFTIKQRLLKRLEQNKRVAYQRAQHPQQQKKKTFSKKPKKVEPPKPEEFQDVPF